jgi:hypothetical protein
VNVDSTKDAGIAFLERLLMLSERSPNRRRPASERPDYDHLRTAEAIARFDERMSAAERAQAVSLRRGKRERKHLIERVTVTDAATLARHLGRTPASIVARRAVETLRPLVANSDVWISELLDELEVRWARGEAAWRLPPGDIDIAGEFLALLVAISDGQAEGMDARSFSLRATGDTKAFDRHAGRLAAILGRHFDTAGQKPDQIWTRIGLERFSHPVFVSGDIFAEDAEGTLADGRAPPFAAIHPELFNLLKMRAEPAYILTIENYASFNRYVREIDDGALVIYTGGFASVAVVEFLKFALTESSTSVPFHHWGDIDPGGVRIFRVLEESLPRPPLPYLMERKLAEMHGKPAPRDSTLATIGKSNSALRDLARWLAEGEDVKYLEQEALDPISPLVTRK